MPESPITTETHPEVPYLCGRGLLDKVINSPNTTSISDMCLSDAIDRINQITVGSYYTSMYIGLCSFTRKIFGEDHIFCRKLRGCSNTHRLPGGWIQCSNEAEYLLECCNIEHNIRNKLFPMCFTNISSEVELLIPRSTKSPNDPPRFSDGSVSENSSMFISKTKDSYHIKVDFIDANSKERLEKSVPLKLLMNLNDIKSIVISPRFYTDEFIEMKPDNIQRLLGFYNTKYRDFIDEVVIPQLKQEDINFTIEYKTFNFEDPPIY